MEIKFKKTHPDAKLPVKNHYEDSGHDIFAVEDVLIPSQSYINVPTGIHVAYISPGYWFKIESRSGLSFKYGILAHPGVVDCGYRGNASVLLYNHSNKDYQVKKGDKIAQLVVYQLIHADVSWSEEIIITDRGDKGFGSSGR